jgi:hypothetical protein
VTAADRNTTADALMTTDVEMRDGRNYALVPIALAIDAARLLRTPDTPTDSGPFFPSRAERGTGASAAALPATPLSTEDAMKLLVPDTPTDSDTAVARADTPPSKRDALEALGFDPDEINNWTPTNQPGPHFWRALNKLAAAAREAARERGTDR